MLRNALVAAEELVAAISGQHDFYLAARLAREIPGGKTRGVSEGLVERRDDRLEIRSDRAEWDAAIRETESRRSVGRHRRLVHIAAWKAGIRAEIGEAVREPTRDHGGVDPPERNTPSGRSAMRMRTDSSSASSQGPRSGRGFQYRRFASSRLRRSNSR